MYYDKVLSIILDCDTFAASGLGGLADKYLASMGVYKIIERRPVYDPSHFYLHTNGEVVEEDGQYFMDYVAVKYPDSSLLLNAIALGEVAFAGKLALVDQKATRPTQSITEALSEGLPPDSLDLNMLWQYSQIKQTNRELLAKLKAATTWEEAEAIKPWIPWESQPPEISSTVEPAFPPQQNAPTPVSPEPAAPAQESYTITT